MDQDAFKPFSVDLLVADVLAAREQADKSSKVIEEVRIGVKEHYHNKQSPSTLTLCVCGDGYVSQEYSVAVIQRGNQEEPNDIRTMLTIQDALTGNPECGEKELMKYLGLPYEQKCNPQMFIPNKGLILLFAAISHTAKSLEDKGIEISDIGALEYDKEAWSKIRQATAEVSITGCQYFL